MLWNWWVVLAAVVVCVGAAVAVALLRTPEQTATAKLSVGRIDISAPGALSGFASATEALATGYSRTVTALPVARAVSAKTGVAVKDVQNHLRATPIKESPIFKVEATSSDADQAISLANASSRALIRYAARLSRSNPDSKRLFAGYQEAIARRKQTRRRLDAARAAEEQRPSRATEAAVANARSQVETASLRVRAVGDAYTLSVQSQVATRLIQQISPANVAVSDRRQKFLIYCFIGLVAGLLLGAGLAYSREARLDGGT